MPHVLVVDDEKPIRKVLRVLLEEQGYTVSEAGCGADALARFAREPADAVLLDLRLPDIDGLETMSRIQSLGGRPPAWS